MIRKLDIHDSKLFQTFKTLNTENPFSVVAFYKKNEAQLHQLNTIEHQELTIAYGDALLKLKKHKTYLKIADQLIEHSIQHNIKFVQGEDIYQKTLYQKGQAYFQLHDYKAAAHIAQELIKIQPKHPQYRNLLRRCMIRNRPQYIKDLLMLGVAMYLLSVLLIIIGLLASPYYQSILEKIKIAIFGIGFLALAGGELLHHIKIHIKINRFQQKALQKQQH